MRRYITLLILALMLPVYSASATEEPLAADQAFSFSAEPGSGDSLKATWNIADGYYLYKSKIRFETDTPGVALGSPVWPSAKVKHDEFFGEVPTYRGQITIDIPIERAAGAPAQVNLIAHSQGCADMGICYPPQTQGAHITLAAAGTPSSPADRLRELGNSLLGGTNDGVLDPDQAFSLSTEVVDNTVRAHWDIAPGHYLYRNKISVALKDADGVRLGNPQLPPGEEKNLLGSVERVFHNSLDATVPLIRQDGQPARAILVVGYQGCAEAGICYPPMTKEVKLNLPAANGVVEAAGEMPGTATTGAAAPLSEQDSLAQKLASGNMIVTLATFLGLGLLLAFTPCVFPMIPILSSIIVGQGSQITTGRAFSMSLVYVLAMAVTYTVAGVVAGLFGANLQATFQNPWVLSAFAAVFVLLALSMFGFYELQLPSSWQGKLSEVSNRQHGGTLAGVGIMGFLSALIVGPCVAPPLMGALIYIGQTGDPWLGGAALFSLSLGMGAPLLAIGTAGGKLLPRAGSWMDAVKAVFGVLLLGVAIWMLERILPAMVSMILWAALTIGAGIYLGARKSIQSGAGHWKWLRQGTRFAFLLYGGLLLIGAATGGTDPMAPLSRLHLAASGDSMAKTAAHLQFTRIKSVEDLQRELAQAKASKQPVMLDFYADWCVSCKEFEKYTFSEPRVISALQGARLLQADVTANDAKDKALLQHFQLIGPPAILFWNGNGQEQRNQRVVGFMEAEPFTKIVDRAIR